MALLDDIHAYYLLYLNARGLQSRLKGATRHLKVHQTRLEQIQTQQGELSAQLKQSQTSAQTLEHQARDLEEKIDKLRKQMLEVTNNKEYSALLVEVNTLKLEQGKIEEQALVHMSESERLQTELEGVKAKEEEQTKMVAAAEKEVATREGEVREELDAVTAKRDEAAKGIPADIVKGFNRLADQHDGEAMASVIETDRKRHEYNCGGCYMTLPIEFVNSLAMQPDTLTYCSSCGRILFLEGDLKADMSPNSAK